MIETRTVKIEAVTKPRRDVKGKENIGVKIGTNPDRWATCYVQALWPKLIKGATLDLVIEKEGFYTNIIDFAADELGIAPTYDDQPRLPFKEVIPAVPNDLKIVLEALKRIESNVNTILQNQLPPLD